MFKKINRKLVLLKKYTHKKWYLPLISVLAGLDILVLFIPTDGILISSVYLQKKRWFQTFLWVTTGSAIGSFLIAYGIQTLGQDFFEHLAGKLVGSSGWADTVKIIDQYGFWGIWFFAFGPFPAQPAIIIAATAHMPLTEIFVATWLGRGVKYFFFAWAASHAPHLLRKFALLKGK